jgi:hypothetical protein
MTQISSDQQTPGSSNKWAEIAGQLIDRFVGKNMSMTYDFQQLLEPAFFSTANDETGLFDKLKSAKEFAKKLSDHGITLSFLRKGKEAITLGSDAKPTLSKLITRSDDVQINSVTQTTNLKRDFKVD